jgi:ATP-dependent helicase/DNAse subunit B
LWQALRNQIKQEVRNFLERDLKECAELGFKPAYFEQPFFGRLEPPLDHVDWGGWMDRIDVSSRGARVVDYKTGSCPLKGKITSLALRGRKAQPPLYIVMAQKFLRSQKNPLQNVSFAYRRVSSQKPGDELNHEDWEATKGRILETIVTQLDLMKKGVFVIHPDNDYSGENYCGRCDFSALCRVNHSYSSHRAKKGEGKKVRDLRAKKI